MLPRICGLRLFAWYWSICPDCCASPDHSPVPLTHSLGDCLCLWSAVLRLVGVVVVVVVVVKCCWFRSGAGGRRPKSNVLQEGSSPLPVRRAGRFQARAGATACRSGCAPTRSVTLCSFFSAAADAAASRCRSRNGAAQGGRVVTLRGFKG